MALAMTMLAAVAAAVAVAVAARRWLKRSSMSWSISCRGQRYSAVVKLRDREDGEASRRLKAL